jgi:hypothetical protein
MSVHAIRNLNKHHVGVRRAQNFLLETTGLEANDGVSHLHEGGWTLPVPRTRGRKIYIR